jgi:hypothetical protein
MSEGIKISKKANTVRGVQVTIICEGKDCHKERLVRVADIKRGTGRFCSKSCSSKHREDVKKGFVEGEPITYLKEESDRAKLPSDLNVKIGKI